MRIAKAIPEDFNSLRNFLQICDNVLVRQKYGDSAPQDFWEEWDDDDDEKKDLLHLRDSIAKRDCIEPEQVDNRILMYEYLKQSYRSATYGWERVYYAGQILVEQVCDDFEKHLEYHPMFEQHHVANEQ